METHKKTVWTLEGVSLELSDSGPFICEDGKTLVDLGTASKDQAELLIQMATMFKEAAEVWIKEFEQ